MKTQLKLLSVAALSMLSLTAPYSAHAKTVHVAIDLSGSNPLLAHANFAHVASNYVTEQIAPLKSGDVVRVQTFGARNDPANMLDALYEIDRHKRPKDVGAVIAQYIRSLPTRPNIAQGATNILAFLEFHPGFDCANDDHIVLLTDGLESSSTVNALALAEGKAQLPEPDISLKGCTLTFYGLGAGLPPEIVKNVRKAWQNWAEKAGATFHVVIR